MKENNTAMNMATKHSYDKYKNEFVRLKFAKTSFSKTNLLVKFPKYKYTKIFNPCMVNNQYIIHTCMHILQIYRSKNVQLEHANFENFTIKK